MRNKNKIFLFILKTVITGLLILFFAIRGIREVIKIRTQRNDDFSLREFFVVDEKKVQKGALTRTLNQLIPDFNYLVQLHDRKISPDSETLDQYIKYYQKVTELSPRSAESYGVLGFCYYYRGKIPEAIRSFEKAVENNPLFFYFYYNLGAIYFHQGQFRKAEEYFTKAWGIREPRVTLVVIATSKIYQQIRLGSEDFPRTLEARWRVTHQRCLFWLNIIKMYHLEDSKDIPEVQNLELKIF